MNTERLLRILYATCTSFRKGERVVEENRGGVKSVHIYDMAHADEAPPELEMVDVYFLVIGVDRAKAEQHKAELIGLLRGYSRLKAGPSYIEVGAELDSQDAALRLFALGKVLGLWGVVLPENLGAKTKEECDALAGIGYVMTTGFYA